MAGVPPLRLDFVTSADRVERLPDSPAEVAVAGRSNVGKSSLINALANRRELAKVSGTPGRTQLLNLFEMGPAPAPTLVDLPGYGYAKAPARVRATWGPMIEAYVLERSALRMVIVLVDGAVGPTSLDLDMLAWVRHHGVPHTVVATKSDKVRAAQRDRRRRDLAAGCELEPGDVLWVSSSKGTGIDTLRTRINGWVGREPSG